MTATTKPKTPGRATHQPKPKGAAPGRATTPAPTTPVSEPDGATSGRAKLPAPTKASPRPNLSASVPGQSLDRPELSLLAGQLSDIEALRISVENRHRQSTRSVDDVDGHVRGFGLTDDDPAVIVSAALVGSLLKIEHEMSLALAREMRRHPLGPWQKATLGVGEKQLARLLAAIHDPYWNEADDQPRRVSDLWSYCGVGDPVKQKRQRGEKASWSATAKFRSWLIAQKCMMNLRSPYRAVYDAAREKYAEALHDRPCVRCGPAGKPAEPGSALSLAHQHARGLRAVQKELLKDLWIEARRLHQIDPGIDHGSSDTLRRPVGAGSTSTGLGVAVS